MPVTPASASFGPRSATAWKLPCAAGLLATFQASAWAQSITVVPLASAAVPVDDPAALMAAAAAVGALAWKVLRTASAPASRVSAWGAAVVATSMGVSGLWGQDVMAQLAQLQRAFTQAGGETQTIPIQATVSGGTITAFAPVLYTNQTSASLRITGISAANWETCFPGGIPATLPAQVPLPQTRCTAGAAMAPAAACWVDTAALCEEAALAALGAAPSLLVPDTTSTTAGVTVQGNVLANDSDADGALFVTRFELLGQRYNAGQTASSAALGSFSLQREGDFVFTPANPFAGSPLAVTYTTHTGASSTLTVTVVAPNRVPVAQDDTAFAQTLQPVMVQVLANDSDPDGHPLTVSHVGLASAGTVRIDPVSGNPVYESNAGFTGSDSFQYTVDDGQGGQAIATVRVTVTASPFTTVQPDSATTDEDTPYNGNVLTNDSDPQVVLQVSSFTVGGNNYAAGATAQLTEGRLRINADGAYLLEPALNFYGSLPVVTYTTNTGASSTLTLTVLPVNDVPVAVDDFYETAFETAISWPVSALPFFANDTDADGDPLSAFAVSNPVNGTINLQSGNLVFQPTPGFSGMASFRYSIHDGHGGYASATVHVTVRPDERPPVLIPDAVTDDEDTVVTGNVLSNDLIRNNHSFSLVSFSVLGDSYPAGSEVTLPGAGRLTIQSTGAFQFEPELDYNGALPTVTYTTTSTNAATGVTVLLSSTLDITLIPVNDPPVAADDFYETAFETAISWPVSALPFFANDTDADGDPLSAFAVSNPVNGTINLQSGNLVFQPTPGFSGMASFRYSIHDGHGGYASASVYITVRPQ